MHYIKYRLIFSADSQFYVPPATIVTQVIRDGKKLRVTVISHDDGEIDHPRSLSTAQKQK